MPMIGLGTWQYNDTLAQASLATAFSMGYRHVDTAYGYENQVGVGKALAASGLPLCGAVPAAGGWPAGCVAHVHVGSTHRLAPT